MAWQLDNVIMVMLQRTVRNNGDSSSSLCCEVKEEGVQRFDVNVRIGEDVDYLSNANSGSVYRRVLTTHANSKLPVALAGRRSRNVSKMNLEMDG